MASELVGQILRFGAVGGVGFVVDGGLLWLLTSNGTDAYVARAISFPIAVVATWLLNRNWTFRATKRVNSKRRQFGRYFGVQMVGSLTNYAIYALWISVFGTSQLMIFFGFAIGSAVGSVLNFVGARYFAFSAVPAGSRRAGGQDADRNI